MDAIKENVVINSITDDIVKDYLAQLKQIPLLSAEEERLILQKIFNGDKEAKKQFTERNLRLVVDIARHYVNKGMPFIDLIQEGNLGLLKAIEKFDITKGYKFSTYATWWIKESIVQSVINVGKTIRLPYHKHKKLDKYLNAIEFLKKELHHDPTDAQLAAYMNISENEIKKIQQLHIETVSIHTLLDSEGNRELEDTISVTEDMPENKVFNDELTNLMEKLLNNSNLSENEISVIKWRYGFENIQPKTLEEISFLLSFSTERIRQMEKYALQKLKKSKYIDILAGYKDEIIPPVNNIHSLTK